MVIFYGSNRVFMEVLPKSYRNLTDVVMEKETIEIYMLLARWINNQKLTDELNDLVMKYSV